MSSQTELAKQMIEAEQEERRQLAISIANMEKDLDAKRARLNSIDIVIEHTKFLYDIDVEHSNTTSPPSPTGMTFSSPVAEGTYKILEDTKRSLKLKEIAEEFYRRGWPLSKVNGNEVIRNAVKKRSDIFQKNSDFTYSLKPKTAHNIRGR